MKNVATLCNSRLSAPALALAFLLAGLVFTGGATAARAEEAKRTITVSGTGEVSAAPNIAFIETGVVTEAPTAAAALASNTKAMNAVFGGLEEMKIARADIQTSDFSVNPLYDNPPVRPDGTQKAPTIRGYQVNNQVVVKIRNLKSIGAALDKLVTLGSNRINNIRFSIEKPGPLQDKARQLAVADALRKAKLLATSAGVTLGPVMSISESGDYQPRPMYVGKAMMEQSAVPIAEGTQTLTSNVSLVVEID